MSDPTKLCDWRTSPIGIQNWEVCHRMLIHDLVDLNLPAVNELLAYYNIEILPNGAHTAALPRLAYTRKPLPTKSTKSKKGKKQ